MIQSRSVLGGKFPHLKNLPRKASHLETSSQHQKSLSAPKPSSQKLWIHISKGITTQVTHDNNAYPSPSTEQLSPTTKNLPAKQPTSTPFGRAFYNHQALYDILGIPSIFLYSLSTNIFTTIYWNNPTISSIQILAHTLPLHSYASSNPPFRDPRSNEPLHVHLTSH